MSNHEFVKGECRLCGGHLEFPAEAIGKTIACPHCGQSIELQATESKPKAGGRRLWVIGIALLACGAVAAIILLGRRSHPTAGTFPPSTATTNVSNPPITPEPKIVPASPPVEPPRPGEVLTNSFGISGGTMQSTSGSSLVYVLGTVRNLSDRQRFGVKVEFSLLDAAGQVIGHATDYQSEIDPHAEWDFKALVMESKAVSAHFSGITEQ
jgi:hypothetical protein